MDRNIYTFMSNSQKDRRIGFQAAHTMLSEHFINGSISYFRTDGFIHAPLQVLKEKQCDKFLLECIENTPYVDISDIDDVGYVDIKADRYMLAWILKAASPAELCNHAPLIIADYAKNPDKEILEPEDIYLGINHNIEIRDAMQEQSNGVDFSFDEYLKDTSVELRLENNTLSFANRLEAKKETSVNFSM